MTKQEVILRLVESLNRGNSGGACDRVRYALAQYNQLVEAGIFRKEDSV